MMALGVSLLPFLFLVTLIATGLLVLMQGITRPRQPSREPVASDPVPASVSKRQLTPLDLRWQRLLVVPLPWAKMNAGLLMAMVIGLIGVGSVLTILGLVGNLNLIVGPGNLLWIATFLLILSALVLLLINGIQDWQRVKALEAQGVMLDRWVVRGKGEAYCVAYYFDLPGGNAPMVRAEQNDEAYHAYQVGDVMQVRYLPDNPQVCRLEIVDI